MQEGTQLWGKAPDLSPPIAKHRCRSYDQRWRDVIISLALFKQACEHRQAFPQAHLVCQTRIQPQALKVFEPGNTALLIIAEDSLQSSWVFYRSKSVFVLKS